MYTGNVTSVESCENIRCWSDGHYLYWSLHTSNIWKT